MIEFKSNFKNVFSFYKDNINKIVFVFLILINLGHLSSVAGFLAQNNEHQTIIFSQDNDAGRGITTAQRTAWYKSNHFHPYGNLYFRLAHTLQFFTPNAPNLETLDKYEINEKSHHMALMLISLFSVYALAILILYIISKNKFVTLALAPLLLSVLLNNIIWSRFTLRVHPDHLQMIFISIATLFFYKLLKYPKSKKYFLISAVFFGLATAVKSFTGVWGIPIAILLFTERTSFKNKIIKIVTFALCIFFSYQIIGFPQNLSIHKTISFLLFNSRLTESADWSSILDWINIFKEQLLYSVPAVILFSIIFGQKDNKYLGPKIKILIFTLVAPLILFTGKHEMPHAHYAIPFVGSILIALAIVFKSITPQIFQNHKLKLSLISLILLGNHYLNPFSYSYLNQELKKWQKCRPEIRQTWKKVRDLQAKGNFVVADPYTPSASAYDHLRKGDWGLDWNFIKKYNQASVILLKRSYFQRYFAPPTKNPTKEDKKRWSDIQRFYKDLNSNTEITDPGGQRWSKIHDDSCGHIIWKKI